MIDHFNEILIAACGNSADIQGLGSVGAGSQVGGCVCADGYVTGIGYDRRAGCGVSLGRDVVNTGRCLNYLTADCADAGIGNRCGGNDLGVICLCVYIDGAGSNVRRTANISLGQQLLAAGGTHGCSGND